MIERLSKWIFKSPRFKIEVNVRNTNREQRTILREIGVGVYPRNW